MAGKREVDAATSPSLTLSKLLARATDSHAKASEDALSVPTVMVTRTDGDELAKFFSHPRPLPTPSLQMRLLVASASNIFNSEFFGNFDYPKVWVSKTVGEKLSSLHVVLCIIPISPSLQQCMC